MADYSLNLTGKKILYQGFERIVENVWSDIPNYNDRLLSLKPDGGLPLVAAQSQVDVVASLPQQDPHIVGETYWCSLVGSCGKSMLCKYLGDRVWLPKPGVRAVMQGDIVRVGLMSKQTVADPPLPVNDALTIGDVYWYQKDPSDCLPVKCISISNGIYSLVSIFGEGFFYSPHRWRTAPVRIDLNDAPLGGRWRHPSEVSKNGWYVILDNRGNKTVAVRRTYASNDSLPWRSLEENAQWQGDDSLRYVEFEIFEPLKKST